MATGEMMDEHIERDVSPTSMWYLHALFCFIYIVLLADIVLLSLHQNSDFPPVPEVDKIASLFYGAFRGNADLDILEGFWPGPAIIFALASFGLLHFAISRAKPTDTDVASMNYVLSFFRLVFYVCMTLLAILIVIRTAVMTYHDFLRPNPRGVIYGVAPPKR